MIYCNPMQVIIEGGDATCKLTVGLDDKGVGIACVDSCEPGEIGDRGSILEDFNPQESAVVWLFKNIESLDVVIRGLNKIRSDMEAFEKENGDSK